MIRLDSETKKFYKINIDKTTEDNKKTSLPSSDKIKSNYKSSEKLNKNQCQHCKKTNHSSENCFYKTKSTNRETNIIEKDNLDNELPFYTININNEEENPKN